MNDSLIIDIVENEVENGFVDFKKQIYNFNLKKCKEDFLIDVMSFANSHIISNKYIIAGVDLKKNGTRDICGIDMSLVQDGAVYQNLVSDNIEPTINVDFKIIEYKPSCNVAIFIIGKDNVDQPYLFSKEYGELKKGFGKIRKGQRNDTITRRDYDSYYNRKEEKELSDICLKTLFNGKIYEEAYYDKFSNPIQHKEVIKKVKEIINAINEIDLIRSLGSSFGTNSRVLIKNDDMEAIKRFAKKNMISLKDDFFDLGNLTQMKISPVISTPLSGSESEKQKYELLQKLGYMVQLYYGMDDYYNNLFKYYNLSIIIENKGKKYDEEVEIILKIKRNKFLMFEELPIPSRSVIGKINEKIEKILEIGDMHGVNEYKPKNISVPPSKINVSSSLPLGLSISNKDNYYSDVEYYKDLIVFKTDYDFSCDDEYLYIKTEIKSIKPNEKIKFPTILFFKQKPTFIDYEIKTKYNPYVKNGRLNTKK